ncbi:lytic transglycosylase domain-containing protein [Massilia orientalis]|uniref:Lytic transglycosylase domain-containing protein n=1 Tax=Massilia orientalis TaxID=3050128 RepID=A0ACC7MGA5_9BURK|nr:lytic transglycosylase domain-containing protein [Massilia sp. YIM B02787]
MADYGDIIEQAGRQFNVDPKLLALVVKRESGGNPGAVSPKGAIGPAQLMPGTAKEMGVADINDPVQNIMAGAKYLSQQLDKYQDVPTALAAYNAGPGAVDKHRGIPPYPETQNYVKGIMSAYQGGQDQESRGMPGLPPVVDDKQSGAPDPFSVLMSKGSQATMPPSAPTSSQHQDADPFTVLMSKTSAPANAAKPEDHWSITNLGAQAGHAFGTSMLGAQQLVGKGLSAIGADGIGDWLQHDAERGVARMDQEVAPYTGQHPVAEFGGKVLGLAVNPINKLVPGAGAESGLASMMWNGAKAGAVAGATTTPVKEGEPFWLTKLQQGATGALGGAVGAPIGATLGSILNSGVKAVTNAYRTVSGTVKNLGADAEQLISNTLAHKGVDPSEVPPEYLAGLRAQVQDALRTGKPVDDKALGRLAQANSLPVPVPMTSGQISRDPMQFAVEQNLRGVHGVGEPITDLLQRQNRALIDNLNALGAKDAPDVVDAGKTALASLRSADDAARARVGAAYDAFRNATGRDLDVPLQGLAQDYARVMDDFGDAVPSAVRRKFEGLGLSGGTQMKTFSIQDAEGLIKNINANYDPKNLVQARALDQLRQSVQRSIQDGAGSSATGGQAAQLAAAARQAAKQRFDLIDQVPLYKAAITGQEPDKVISKYILGGNAADIGVTMKLLGQTDPHAAAAVKGAVLDSIKRNVLNGSTDENGIFSQAALKKIVNDPNSQARLQQVLSPEENATLKRLAEVAENALMAPKSAAVNTSNTTSAAANLVNSTVTGGLSNKALNIGKESKIPVVSGLSRGLLESQRTQRLSDLVNGATNPGVSAPLNSNESHFLADMLRIGGTNAGAGSSARKTTK